MGERVERALILLMVGAACIAADPAGAAEEPDLRLYVLDCGTIVTDDPTPFSLSRGEVASLELAVPCFLIVHPRGTLLWDAGLPDEMAVHPEGTRMNGMLLRLDRTLESQLEELGHPAGRVSHVAFSHLHFDHAGNGNLFADAVWLVQRAERETAFPANPEERPSSRHYAKLRDAETRLLDGDHDVFGDGRVMIFSAPGHTPGHQVLLVDFARTGPVLLSGDVYHFPESRRLRRVPTLNSDREASLASIDRVEALLEERGARLWIQHAAARLELRMAPDFYE